LVPLLPNADSMKFLARSEQQRQGKQGKPNSGKTTLVI
jgi:hypothetical protein